MPPQAPRIAQTGLVSGATSEAHHHTRGAAGLAESSRVVDSWGGLIAPAVQLVPAEGCSFDAQAPDIVDGLSPRVASIHEKVRLREYNRVTVAAPWS